MSLAVDPVRLWAAFMLLSMYAAACAALWQRHRRRAPARADGGWIVAYASQTGTAEYLAAQTVATLKTAGLAAVSRALSDLDEARMAQAERILFIVSTFGEGDAPDNAARFVRFPMQGAAPLGHLRYAVLALGDSGYDNFCGFGRALDRWLAGQGARALFGRVEVDRGNEAAIEEWQAHLCHLSGADDASDWSEPPYGAWTIVERVLSNPGSAGGPVYRVLLEPVDGALPAWESGDLVQVSVPHEPGLPREYSIASVTAEGRIDLLVRLRVRADGTPGLASGWLCLEALPGQAVRLRLRAHRRFRLDDNAQRPLILIGNGTGIAGLRGHLKARIGAGMTRNWLIFGERNAHADFHYRSDIDGWHDGGKLDRVCAVFSRDQPQRRYVQDVLRESGDALRAWVGQGAAIYVCGSLRTMAAGVNAALVEQLGQEQVDLLAAEGRYRRDVY